MKTKLNKTEIAAEWCRKYPEKTNTEISRLLCKKHPILFTKEENARSMVRKIRGANRKAASNEGKSIFGSNHGYLKKYADIAEDYLERFNPFAIPETYMEVKKPFHFPKHSKKLLILNDIHIPYHSIEAVNLAIAYGVHEDVDTILLNGDILDFYQISEHEKNPAKVSIKIEIELAKEFFLSLRNAFPTQDIYFISGNHENRLRRFLWKHAKQIFDLDHVKLDELLCLKAFDIKYLEHLSVVFWGKLLIEHGDKLRGSGGVNPARTLLLKFKRSVVCGHFHRTSMANSVVYQGDTHMAWSVGSLCELNPDYLPVNEWNHGFAIVEKDEEGDFIFHNKQIQKGKVF